MIPRKWAINYLKKSGDSGFIDGNVEVFHFGFFVWETNDNGDLVVLHAYAVGNHGRDIDRKIMLIAKKVGAKKIVFATRRNPKAFERKFGYKLVGYILEKEIDNGWPG